MSHGKHGPSIADTADANGNHHQTDVAATAQTAVDAMKAGQLHVEPVSEFAGTFKGKDGVFKTFHASGK